MNELIQNRIDFVKDYIVRCEKSLKYSFDPVDRAEIRVEKSCLQDELNFLNILKDKYSETRTSA